MLGPHTSDVPLRKNAVAVSRIEKSEPEQIALELLEDVQPVDALVARRRVGGMEMVFRFGKAHCRIPTR